MFSINQWDTGKEQDILDEALFGNVDLISYKKNIVTEQEGKTEGNKRKRKASHCEDIAKTKFDKQLKELSDCNDKMLDKVCFGMSAKLNNEYSTEPVVSEIDGRKRKKKKKDKQSEETVKGRFNKLETQKNCYNDTACNKIDTIENDLLSNKSDIEHEKSKSEKKKKRKKKKVSSEPIGQEDEETVKGRFNKAETQKNRDNDTVCNEIDDLIENDLLSNKSDIEHEKSKSEKKKKRKKKKVSLEPIDHTRNKNINLGNSVVRKDNMGEQNIDESKNSASHKFATKYSKFQKKIMEKLKGGQFRWINEKLYSCESSDAVDMFSSDPKLFDVYHEGFNSQVQQWPQNPVDAILAWIKARDNELVIADFGCGDAKIARTVPNKVHSFDLVAVNEHVTACDMKKVPLPKNSVDIAVFCLSLMGTNIFDFLIEAHRVIKEQGVLKIAEVKSRFEDTDKFIEDVSSIGFSLTKKDDSNKMFILLEFQKTEKIPSKKVGHISLKPCIYKRR